MNPLLSSKENSQALAPAAIAQTENKDVLVRKSEHCLVDLCKECPGTGNDGIWHFNDPILEAKKDALLELTGYGAVRCPCGCHYQ